MTAARPLGPIPSTLGHAHRKPISTQAALGRLLADLPRDAPETAARVVTCSPDVASSTNLGGWINKTEYGRSPTAATGSPTTPSGCCAGGGSNGRRVELGIAEVNLVSLLGERGATWSRWGEPLIPGRTLYDPFVSRALEPSCTGTLREPIGSRDWTDSPGSRELVDPSVPCRLLRSQAHRRRS